MRLRGRLEEALVGSRRVALGCCVVACSLMARPASADVVDEAYARGNEAAARGDWSAAVDHYEEARRLLPGHSAALEHDLGIALGNAGRVGRASYHLRLALRADADAEVGESARRSLSILRRRAELEAAASGAQISPSESWSDLLRSALAARGVAWLSLLAGWALLGVVALRAWTRHRAARAETTRTSWQRPVTAALAALFGITAVAHEAAVSAESSGRPAIVLDERVEVRDGPGAHRPVAFELQGSSLVRIVEDAPGWSRVRVAGGLEGWVHPDSLGELGSTPTK